MAQAHAAAGVPDPVKEYTVVWQVEEWASSPEAAAMKVAKNYFQDRIAHGENGTACVFTVDGNEISLDYVIGNMPSDQLAEVFGHEHPGYPRYSWRVQVENDNTLLGYWAWVKHGLTL